MKNYWIVAAVFFIVFLLTSCSSLGENFFIRNYENETVNVKYIYNQYENDSSNFDFPTRNFVLVSDTILNKKVLNQFPYKSHLYFDTLKVNRIDRFIYELEIPAKSTIHISPIYYINNIDQIIINNSDTIRFVSEYPYVENGEFIDQRIIKYNPRLIGDSYYILNLKLKEIARIHGK